MTMETAPLSQNGDNKRPKRVETRPARAARSSVGEVRFDDVAGTPGADFWDDVKEVLGKPPTKPYPTVETRRGIGRNKSNVSEFDVLAARGQEYDPTDQQEERREEMKGRTKTPIEPERLSDETEVNPYFGRMAQTRAGGQLSRDLIRGRREAAERRAHPGRLPLSGLDIVDPAIDVLPMPENEISPQEKKYRAGLKQQTVPFDADNHPWLFETKTRENPKERDLRLQELTKSVSQEIEQAASASDESEDPIIALGDEEDVFISTQDLTRAEAAKIQEEKTKAANKQLEEDFDAFLADLDKEQKDARKQERDEKWLTKEAEPVSFEEMLRMTARHQDKQKNEVRRNFDALLNDALLNDLDDKTSKVPQQPKKKFRGTRI